MAACTWTLDELDALHMAVGLGPEWLASDTRAILTAARTDLNATTDDEERE